MHLMNQELHANAQEDCIFCNIVNGKIPAKKIYEDEFTIAFLDIAPTQHGHCLVIPKDHFENLYTLPTELYCRVQMVVQKIALAVRNAVDADGTNVIINNEAAAGQMVFHHHTHIIPRHNDDGLAMWPHKTYKTDEEITVIQDKIIATLKEDN